MVKYAALLFGLLCIVGPAMAETAIADPGEFSLGTDLTNVFGGVTLTVHGENNTTVVSGSGFNLIAARNIASTGSRTFHQTTATEVGGDVQPSGAWGEVVHGLLKATFDNPTNFVAVDVICDDNDIGFLRAFDRRGEFLSQSIASCSGGTFVTTRIDRPISDISFVLVGGENLGAVWLDNLQFQRPIEAVATMVVKLYLDQQEENPDPEPEPEPQPVFCPADAGAPQFVLRDLGPHPPNVSVGGFGYSIDPQGRFAGTFTASQDDFSAVIATPGGGTTIVVPSKSSGNAINRFGHVTGSTFEKGRGIRAFYWNGQSTYQIGTLGGADSWGSEIGPNGEVVGESRIQNSDRHAFFWRNRIMVDLGTLGGNLSTARAVSGKGYVTGLARRTDGLDHAFLWRDGVMIDLGALGGDKSVGNAVNDHGDVGGWSSFAFDVFDSEGLFDFELVYPVATLWTNGETIRLSNAEDEASNAKAINNSGNVVGWVKQFGGAPNAFLWDGDRMCRLPQLEATGGFNSQSTAWEILDNGVILGTSTGEDGVNHIVRWSPP